MSGDRYSLKTLSDHRGALMGVATVIIMVLHYYQILGVPFGGIGKSIVMFFSELCNFGVDIFLLLSGMGLYYSLEKDGRILQFYKRRFMRILPEYLLILVIFAYPCGYTVTDVIRLFTGTFFWSTGNPTDWYMALIIPLYLLYPVLHRSIRKSIKAVIIFDISLILLFAGISVVMSVFYDAEFPFCIAISRIPVFIAGACVGRLIKDNRDGIGTRTFVILGISAFVFIDIIITVVPNSMIERLMYGLIASAVALYCGTLMSKASDGNVIVRMLTLLGKISLPFYLINMRLAIYLRTYETFAGLPSVIQIILSIAGTILLSLLCHLACSRIRSLTDRTDK